jgi:hypothetical protein
VREIVAVFRRPTYTEEGPRSEEIRLEVQALMGRMQDLGSPPAEVMGEMPDFVRHLCIRLFRLESEPFCPSRLS